MWFIAAGYYIFAKEETDLSYADLDCIAEQMTQLYETGFYLTGVCS